MIATKFLSVIANYLKNDARLDPVPVTVGITDPVSTTELPAVVLSMMNVRQLGNGLGERSQVITNGALPWTSTLDLENLPSETSTVLSATGRRELVLPHGGLVRQDGFVGALTQTDISVTVAGEARQLAAANPTANQFQVDPQLGRLIFADALPNTGNVIVNYFLGQWEERVMSIAGLLRLTVHATDAAIVGKLSDAAVDALEPPRSKGIAGLKGMNLVKLGSIQPPDEALAKSRARVALLSFEFELKINQPESAGGIILSVQVKSNFGDFAVSA